MQGDNDVGGDNRSRMVAMADCCHVPVSPPHIVSAIVKALEPVVAASVAAQMQISLREPWFADIIRVTVHQYLSTSASGSSQSHHSLSSRDSANLSQSSNGSSGSISGNSAPIGVVVGVLVQPLEANLLWDVPCPVCSKVLSNENVFSEHIKLIVANRTFGYNSKFKCVFRENNDHHVQLLKRWSHNQSWPDAVCDFVTALRSLLNPGHRHVYRPGGTGNNRKVRKFVQECLLFASAPPFVGDPGHAPGHDDWFD